MIAKLRATVFGWSLYCDGYLCGSSNNPVDLLRWWATLNQEGTGPS